jgi:LacI family transcriptional regulator
MKPMSVTIKDIAKEAGVSTAAVSKALNNRGGIGLELKRKIEKIAEQKGYMPYLSSRQTGMYAGASRYIGIIFPFADEYLSREVQRGLDYVLRDSGTFQVRYNLDTVRQLDDEIRKDTLLDKVLQDKSIFGLMTVFFKLADATIGRFRKNGIPVIQLNHRSDIGKCVTIDNNEAAYLATREFIKLGRKKIGLIMPEETAEEVWFDRLQGYKKALAEAKIAYDPYLIVYEHLFGLKDSAIATKILLEREPGIQAILFGSDLQAYGGLEALRKLGKKVPDDIAIIGFDNLPFSKITNPPLSSVSQPMFEMGKIGAEMLLEAVQNKDFSDKTVMLRSQLIFRQSSHKNIPREELI